MSAAKKLDRFGIAAALQEIARLMTMKGGQSRFKAKAYSAGARAIQGIANLERLIEEDNLTSIPRIGTALAAQIKQLYLTGESSVLNELRTQFPAGPPKKKKFTVLHLHHALSSAEQAIEYLKTIDGVEDVSIAGSLRRWEETVGTVDLVASAKDPAAVVEQFLQFPSIESSETDGPNSCVAQFVDGATVSLTVVPPKEFPLAVFVKTGSEAHVAKITEFAAKKKISLARPPRSEDQIYSRLKMVYIPPELREDQGEIEAALEGNLPDDLVTEAHIKGMVHCHTTYSDGIHSLEAMVRGAEEMGMKYITITDHSPTASYAGGLKVDKLRQQWDEIDELQGNVKIKILRGTESDIIANGGLDYSDDILEQFDVIVASIHARYKMDAAKMTERITRAMRHHVFKIWGHGLGRLLQRRPPFECDVERILDVIAESKAAIEINGDPYRLDLEPRWVREARKRKIKFVISTDAHSVKAMTNLKYGVAMARRGWVTRKEVLNTLPTAGFQKAVKPI
ncbi:MAG TPA: PHP domain-containing protein [Pyrinomonadaceae bacterium]|nr:PHP domain-containing protein [Pyrinomonadaceae bacterium]